jgi:plasmid maintenance system killer protein
LEGLQDSNKNSLSQARDRKATRSFACGLWRHALHCDRDQVVQAQGRRALKGKLENHWSISVSGNWRLTFMFENGDAVLVDYQDYH